MYICKGVTCLSSLNAGAWSNGADLKSAVFALVGSNPTSSINKDAGVWSNGADLKSAVFARVGSNPTPCTNIYKHLSTWLNG